MTLLARVDNAIKNYPQIMVDNNQLKGVTGFPYNYMKSIGLEKRHLKKLEAKGQALRAYLPIKPKNIGKNKLSPKVAVWVILKENLYANKV